MMVFTDGTAYAPIKNALQAIAHNRVERPAFGFANPFFSPGGYGDCWWEIDTSFAAEGYSWHDFSMAQGIMENFMSVQKPDGRIPLYGYDRLPVSEHHPKQIDNASALPVLPEILYGLAKRSGDRAFHERAYTLIRRYLDWWMRERYDEKTGLVTSLFEETFPPYLGSAGEYCGVDTNVLVADGMRKVALLAEHLGLRADAGQYRKQSGALFSAVNRRLWDGENALFRPLYLSDGTFGAKTAEGFYMLLDPDLPEDRTRALLRSLQGADFGWGQLPVTSMARSDPAYTITKSDSYAFNESWSGMVWTLINRYIVYGLVQQGQVRDGAALAQKTVALLRDGAREFYAPDDGRGWGASSYAWSAAHAIDLYLCVLCGIRYDAWTRNLEIAPLAPVSAQLRDVALGDDCTADLTLENGTVKEAALHTDVPVSVSLRPFSAASCQQTETVIQ